MNGNPETLIDIIKMELEMVKAMHQINSRPGFKYLNMEDFILKEGISVACSELTSELKHLKGLQKECFRNAYRAVTQNPDLCYIEGFGTIEEFGLFKFYHAWVGLKSDPSKGYELTWKKPGTDYFGVVIPTPILNRIVFSSELHAVIDSYPLGWPLLKVGLDLEKIEEIIRERKSKRKRRRTSV